VLGFGVVDKLVIMLGVMDGKTLDRADGTVLGSEVGTALGFILGVMDGKTLG